MLMSRFASRLNQTCTCLSKIGAALASSARVGIVGADDRRGEVDPLREKRPGEILDAARVIHVTEAFDRPLAPYRVDRGTERVGDVAAHRRIAGAGLDPCQDPADSCRSVAAIAVSPDHGTDEGRQNLTVFELRRDDFTDQISVDSVR